MRFVVNTDKERREMMDSIGIGSVQELFKDIDEEILLKRPLNLQRPLSEQELLEAFSEISGKNADTERYKCFLGAGAYDHFIPSVVPCLVGRSEFYTAYTPYQAEASQGVLQAIYEFQTLICQLTGMDVCNASLYDGASALAEAAIMASNVSRRGEVIASSTIHPEYREVVKTYVENRGLEFREVGWEDGVTSVTELAKEVSDKTSAVLVQNPNFFGNLEDLDEVGKIAHEKKALFVVCVVEPTSLGLLKAPGEFGADIAAGEGQSLGNSVSFGGPHLGFLAARQEFLQKMPGRLVGMTTDTEGRRGFVMTLQAREQHVRREKATSNICSNQALNALAATVYLAALGRRGFRKLSTLNAQKARYLRSRVLELKGFEARFEKPYYNEFVVRCPIDPRKINEELTKRSILGGLPVGRFYRGLEDCWLLCATEKSARKDIDLLIETLRGICG
ncbi:MAG: aminomethyl-transferring glycine dehydrogenase subunit GcvPA [Thermoproteota archaeon]